MKMNTLLIVFVSIACFGIIICFLINRQNRSSTEIVNIPSTADEFNILFESAGTRLRPLIALGGYAPKKANVKDSQKLQLCIRELEACLSFKNDHWQSMLFISKAYQALSDHQKSLDWLKKAMEIEKNNSTIPKEASLEAIHLRNIEGALKYSLEAMKRKPKDPELMGNHAMNLLIAKQDEEALMTIREGLEIAPEDEFNKRIFQLITDVKANMKKRPTCESVMP